MRVCIVEVLWTTLIRSYKTDQRREGASSSSGKVYVRRPMPQPSSITTSTPLPPAPPAEAPPAEVEATTATAALAPVVIMVIVAGRAAPLAPRGKRSAAGPRAKSSPPHVVMSLSYQAPCLVTTMTATASQPTVERERDPEAVQGGRVQGCLPPPGALLH